MKTKGSLILDIKPGDTILIGDEIRIQLIEMKINTRVRIIAPKDIQIDREKANGEKYGRKE